MEKWQKDIFPAPVRQIIIVKGKAGFSNVFNMAQVEIRFRSKVGNGKSQYQPYS